MNGVFHAVVSLRQEPTSTPESTTVTTHQATESELMIVIDAMAPPRYVAVNWRKANTAARWVRVDAKDEKIMDASYMPNTDGV